MEIKSHIIGNDAIESMHVVRFEPHANITRVGTAIIANSLAGRITTPDGFGLPYALAAHGYDTLYVEFPGSGFSPLPRDGDLRRKYIKHGSIVLGDPVAELIDDNKDVIGIKLDELTVGGFSLGGIRAATLTPHFGQRVNSYFSADSAGYGTSANLRNMRRYREHLARSEKVMVSDGESIDSYYTNTLSAQKAFLAANYDAFKKNAIGKIAGAIELRGIYDSMKGHILKIMSNVMIEAVAKDTTFKLRAGFVSNAYSLDAKSVEDANNQLDKVASVVREAEAEQRIGVGFIQGQWFGDWHDQASRPDRILRLIHEPLADLSPRLEHIYMPQG